MTSRKASYDPQLAAKVLNLRRAGVQFDAIADQLQLTPRAAKALFDKALGSHDPKFQRALESDRLDRLHAAVWPRALKGDLDALDRLLRISERRERVAATPKLNTHELRDAFDASVDSSPQVGVMDSALVASGRRIAERVDEAVATGEGQELTKALYLIPHMTNVLRELLATPASRKAAEASAPPAPPRDGKLAQLRAIQGSRQTG